MQKDIPRTNIQPAVDGVVNETRPMPWRAETKDDKLVKLQLICRMERDWNVVTSYAIGQLRFLPQGDILYACAF